MTTCATAPPNLYAALDVASGNVIADLTATAPRRGVPAVLEPDRPNRARRTSTVHVVLDNQSTHKTPAIQRWLVRHPRFHAALHTDLQLVAEPRRALVRRAHQQVAPPRHPPLRQRLAASIRTWTQHWNDEPKPFVWHKTADEILDSLAGYCQRISDSGH